MTNPTLRQRFSIAEHNYSIASRIIYDTIKAELIKPQDPENTSRAHVRIPMMSITQSDLMPITHGRSDARPSQCELVIDISQEFC